MLDFYDAEGLVYVTTWACAYMHEQKMLVV